MDGWKTTFLLGFGLFSETTLVSGRVTKTHLPKGLGRWLWLDFGASVLRVKLEKKQFSRNETTKAFQVAYKQFVGFTWIFLYNMTTPRWKFVWPVLRATFCTKNGWFQTFLPKNVAPKTSPKTSQLPPTKPPTLVGWKLHSFQRYGRLGQRCERLGWRHEYPGLQRDSTNLWWWSHVNEVKQAELTGNSCVFLN